MANRPTELTPALHDYLLAHGFREAEILKRLREETQSHEWAIMQITPEQGAFMALLAELIDCRRYLEIGVFTGYSSLVLALAMGPKGHITALDHNALLAGSGAGGEYRASPRRCPKVTCRLAGRGTRRQL